MTRLCAVAAWLMVGVTLPAQAFAPPADWAERDLEGKWMAYRRDSDAHAADKDRRKKWVTWLGERREFELLEWLVVYEGWHVGGDELERREHPGWLRVAVWNTASGDSHDFDAVRKVLRRHAGPVLGWAARFPRVRAEDEALFAELDRTAAPAEAAALLPPLDDAEVLWRYLDVPKVVPEFGDRSRAEPGVRYVHQVVRALRGIQPRAARVPPYLDKVVRLLGHDHPTVVAEAAAALSRLPGKLVPLERLRAVAMGDGDAKVRRLATMALAPATHPRARFILYEIALDAAHPARDAALELLTSNVDGLTVAVLASAGKPLDAGLRWAVEARSQSDAAAQLRALSDLLARAAWARAAGHPLAQPAAEAFELAVRRAGAVAHDLQPTLDDTWDPGEQRVAVVRAMVELLAAARRGR